MGYSCIQR